MSSVIPLELCMENFPLNAEEEKKFFQEEIITLN